MIGAAGDLAPALRQLVVDVLEPGEDILAHGELEAGNYQGRYQAGGECRHKDQYETGC